MVAARKNEMSPYQDLDEFDDRFTYAIEVRDKTWFQDLAYNFFADNNICMV